MKASIKKVILASPLFAGIESSAANELLQSDLIYTEEITKGEKIFTENDFSRSVGIIVKGEARVEKSTGKGAVIMSTQSVGDIFGMAALFYEEQSYPTYITAVKPTIVVFFPEEWLLNGFKKEPRLSQNYITLLSAKIHFLTRKIETLTRRGDSDKLYSYLTAEYKKHGSAGKVTLPYNMAELSKVLGIGRTTLYRELDALHDDNLINRKGKTITFLNLEEL